MPTQRYDNSTAIVYNLIGEGPIRLKNGLASVYLNRTPVSNNVVQAANLGTDAAVYVNSTGTGLLLGYAVLGLPGVFPVLLKGGAKLATGTIAQGSNSLTTTTAFFTTDMLASNSEGDGGLYQKVRIQGAGPNGSELEAEVIQIVSTTSALLNRNAFVGVTAGIVTWDHFTFATETNSFGLNSVTFDTTVPRTDIRNSPAASVETWVPVLATMGNGSVGLGVGSTSTNFKNVKVHFRPGTLDQAPVQNSSGFTSATTGVQINAPLLQVTSIPNGAGGTVSIHNAKLKSFWGDKNIAQKIKPTTPSPSGTTIISGPGTLGLNIANPSEIDEISLDLAFPNGLHAFKAKDSAYETAGCVFQIYFDYKVAGAAQFQSKLMYGPSDAEVASRATAYFVHASGDLARGWNTTGTVKSNNTSNFNYQFRFSVDELKPFDDFRVRILKLTPDSFNVNGFQHTCDSTLSYVQAFISDKLNYPFSSYLALEYNSQEFQGSFAEVSAHCLGGEFSVPINYVTREEAADGVATYTRNSAGTVTSTYVPWNGNFRRAYCNNPAWIIREILLNKRWGLGNWITSDQIDDYTLYSMARYSDDLVPDGEGGLEPRFTCNVYLTVSTEAYKVMKDFFTTMLAIPYWLDGRLTGVQDKPAMPVYTFTKGNIENGLFSYEGTGNKVRPNQVAVTYTDKDYFYEQRIEVIDDIDDIVVNNRILTDEVVAFGATSRGQAVRYGRWKMLTGKMQKDIVSFKTAENAIYLRPGDIIAVQDADKHRVRYSGRLVSGTTTTIVLDKPVEIVSGETYEVHVVVPGPATYLTQSQTVIGGTNYNFGDILPAFTQTDAETLVDDSGEQVSFQFSPDVHLETRAISNTAGVNQSTLNLFSALSAAPINEMIWALVAKNSQGQVIAGSAKDYKILSISEEKNSYGIIAAEHFNAKFDLINEDYLLEPLTDAPRYGDMPAPRDFTAALQIGQGGSDSTNSAIVPRIFLSWRIPIRFRAGLEEQLTNLDGYLLKYQTPQGAQVEVNLSASTTTYVIDTPSLGIYSFSLQSRSIEGPVSRPVVAEVIVQLDSITPGLAAQLKLLRGGQFTRPPLIDAAAVEMPQDYDYTSPVGTQVRIRNGIIT